MYLFIWGFQDGASGKESTFKAGDLGLIRESGRSHGVGFGSPLQNSCLGNPTDRGVWWAMVHGVAKSRTRLKRHVCLFIWLKWPSTRLLFLWSYWVLVEASRIFDTGGMRRSSFSTWDPVSWSGSNPRPPLGTWSFSHWLSGEVPWVVFSYWTVCITNRSYLYKHELLVYFVDQLLLVASFANIFSHSVFPFCLWFPLLCKRLYVSSDPICLFFVFVSITLRVRSRKVFCDWCQRVFCLCFPLGVL